MAHVRYALGHTRPESVMVDISLPGWRWEVEFMLDGSVEIERYQSVSGVDDDPRLLEELLADVDRLALSGMTGRVRAVCQADTRFRGNGL